MSDEQEQDIHVHGDVEKLTLIRSVFGDVNIEGDKVVIVGNGHVFFNQVVIQKQHSIHELKHIPPTPPDLLLGRSYIYEQVLASIYENKKLLLYGMGGMGKTAIAQTIANTALLDSDRFSNGVLWLTVFGNHLQDLLDDILISEDKANSIHLSETQKSKLVRRLLGSQQLLIVLDDVDEDNDSVVREWIRKVHPPNTPLLITSRSKLQAHDAFHISELDREDSTRLLRYYSGLTASQNLKSDTAYRIASSLGDHPLALHLMAYHIAVYYENDPDKVLRQLDSAHENIKKISRGNEKDDNVFVSMDLSWQKLNDDQQKLLNTITALPASSAGDWLLIEASNLDRTDYETAIAELKRVSLIHKQGEKWSNHALIQAYVKAKLNEKGEWDTVFKNAVTSCAFYIASWGEQKKLELEIDNLLQAFQISYENDWGINLFGGLVEMLNSRGYFRQGIVLLDKLVDKIRIYIKTYPNQKEQLTHYVNFLGLFHYRLGNYAEAIQSFQEALAVAVETGNIKQTADPLGNLAMVFRELNDYDNALKCLTAQNELLQSLGPHPAYGNNLVQFGLLFKDLGKYDIAVEFYKKAIAFYNEIGRPELATTAYSNLEAIKMFQNAIHGKSIDQSIALNEKNLEDFLKDNNRYQAAVTMHNLALAYIMAGNVHKYFELLNQGRKLAVEIDAKPLIKRFDEQLAKFDGIDPDDIVSIEFSPKKD